MFYIEILKQSWLNTWKNKYLWFFGLFAALLGNGGEMDIVYRGFSLNANQELFVGWKHIVQTGVFHKETLTNIKNLALNEPLALFVVISLLIFLLALIAFLTWLSVVSQVAIVKSSEKFLQKKKSNFQLMLNIGIKKFIPAFVLNFLIKILLYILFILASLPIMANYFGNNIMLNSALFITMFLLFIPLSVAMSFIIKYAISYLVIKDKTLKQSIIMGIRLFANNWLISLEMAFILFLFSITTGLFLIFLFLILAVPFLFFAVLLSGMAINFSFWFIAGIVLILYIIIVMYIGSVLAVFQTSAWSLLFIKLSNKKGESKLIRLFPKKIL